MRLFYTLLLFFSAAYATAGNAACTNVPRTDSNAPVRVCETSRNYTFNIVGTSYTYAKTDFRAAFSKLIGQWFDEQALPGGRTAVDFWLAVPEANPEATQARAVLRSEDRRFIFFMSPHPAEWSLENIKVSILGPDETYPDYFGHTAGSLLVKRNDQVAENDLHAYMESFNAYDPQFFSPGWFEYSLPVFREQTTKEAVLNDESAVKYVANAELNHVFEWIAQRERVFAFSVDTP